MHITSDRLYHFPVPPAELWSVLERVDDYQRWWPWLRHFDATAFAAHERFVCEVRPPFGYGLRFVIVLDHVDAPSSVTAHVSGDITGTARIDIGPVDAGSELHLVSELAPAIALLRAIARVAAPLVHHSHNWVLDTGVRQFERRALS